MLAGANGTSHRVLRPTTDLSCPAAWRHQAWSATCPAGQAAAAGLCEPRLLKTPEAAACAVEVCARTTQGLAAMPTGERRDAGVRTLRQALGYCWSVAVAADPVAGLPRFLALTTSDDRDVAWIVRENHKKARLAKLL